jgi:hypothetical protein
MLEAAKKADPTLAGPQLLLSSIKSDSQSLKKKVHKKIAKKKKTTSKKARRQH